VALYRFEGSQPSATGRRCTLTVIECTDGRLAVDGLPDDRETRLALVTRLRYLLAAVAHADDVDGEGDGRLWARHCRAAFAAWQSEVRVTLVDAGRELGTPPPG
jgi:hypothetical protein